MEHSLTTTREIPNLSRPILRPLLGLVKKATHEDYLNAIYNFERNTEKKLIDILKPMGINASVKTDPYSLPFRNEIVTHRNYESYLNGAYQTDRILRESVKAILDAGDFDFRFYFWFNVVTPEVEKEGIPAFFQKMGKVEYRFRWYPK